MKEVVCVNLENDMDLILAHKRAMKLCELTGFSLIAQTTIATAISEVARCAIGYGKNAELKLCVGKEAGKKVLLAVIRDTRDFSLRCNEALDYARRLVDDVEVQVTGKELSIILKKQLNYSNIVTEDKLNSFIEHFKNEPPISAYDELRRKNLLLQELAQKLQTNENDFRMLTDSLPMMIMSVNNGGMITYTNKWLQDFFGRVPKGLAVSFWKDLVHSDDASAFHKDVQSAFGRQLSFTSQYRFVEKSSGNFIWHICSMIPLKNEKDLIIRWIGFIFDIHAQKQIEQTLKDNRELKETQKRLFENQSELQRKIIELNRSNYELEQFAHLASHDLQEPLRKLFFYSDVLKKKYTGQMDEYATNVLANMNAAAGRMKELINDLLSYSQLQQQNLVFEDVDLNVIIQEIIRDLDVAIREKMATIEIDHLPILFGNKIRLRQLFLNLVSNALKYSKQGTPPVVRISASLKGGLVEVSVKDNGIGFKEEYREKIFGLFERLHSRDQIPGTGIGLSICRKIAELHHGSISALSTPGEYAEFKVTLPIVELERVAHE